MGGSVFRFGDEVEGPEPKRLHRHRSAFRAMRTENDDGHRLPPHNFFQRVDPVHARHFQIKRDHVRLQLFNFFQGEVSVHRRAHHFNRFVGSQHLRDQLPHQRRIVDHEHAHEVFLHACPPVPEAIAVIAIRIRSVWVSSSPEFTRPVSSGFALAACSTTAGRLRISTTRPSPRIDAPETRSVEKVWSSRALITSSSSPSSASTISPYFLSPTEMTSTKSLALRSLSSGAGRPSRSKGSTC